MTERESIRAVFVNSERLGRYRFSDEHPFKPERVGLVYGMCRERGLLSGAGIEVESVESETPGVLERFHTPEFIDALERANGGDLVDLEMLHHGIGTPENPVFKGIYDFSALSATASLVAARRVMEGASVAFNPCGGFHHAHPDRASGFCYANDVVIAIEELRSNGLRTAYLDVDAHHGDAVQEAYYETDEVLTVSLHETGKTLFPWGGFERETGKGSGEGFNINLPLEPDTDDEIYLELFREVVLDALALFEPDVVVAQAGTDMLATDPLTHLRLTNNGYIESFELLHAAFPRIVALGGGGYNLDDVKRCWTLLWAELSGQELEDPYGGALGGVFLGDTTLQGSNLRDMRSYTSGPAKDRLREGAKRLTDNYRNRIRPLLPR